ncbi:MAG: malto-oligosyltrehalose trehalohydrolase [Pirellulaceae bacterium]|nr:malto-oligosyltrehalose trehalohydrolase [Pirellulaceae bacterium]
MRNNQVGAKLDRHGRCTWRVWAPLAQTAKIVLFGPSESSESAITMTRDSLGYFEGQCDDVQSGQRYFVRLDDRVSLPDPASKWQPDGVHKPSAVWCPDHFQWTDHAWQGVALSELVVYEMHVGTFTAEGSFAAIIPRLAELRQLGVTAIELMPVGQFPGERGWGYDGTYWFAVQQSYGGPSELQRLVNACHACGMAVILDVVYNHFGPEGNYLSQFGPYFTDKYDTPWGSAVHFDGESSKPVRDFVLDNIRHWIRNFHFDGFRLDAIHAIHDESPVHILAETKEVALLEAKPFNRPIHIIAESNLNDVRLLDDAEKSGYGLDAQWSDDFHHCVHTLLTGERDGYYADFDQPAEQLVKSLNDVFVHDGCHSPYRGANHGAPVGVHTGEKFVISIQTHDQVGNRAIGDRFGTLLSPAQQRLAAGLMLIAPNVPMLFMGEEYGESRPFPFFCDFGDEGLREAVRKGRREEFSSFAWPNELPDPMAKQTFESAILSWDWPAGSTNAGLRNLYVELLQLRRTHPVGQNYKDRLAELITSNGNSVLRLARGGADNQIEHLVAYFNLSDKLVDVPSLDELSLNVLLNSDEERFGGSAVGDEPIKQLQPFAFIITSRRGSNET